jgi:hypothetical protein
VLAISIPKNEAAVIRFFQERMPHGVFVSDADPSGLPLGWIVENAHNVEMILSGHAEASARATRLADRECKIIISGGRERCTDLRRPQKLLELDDCRSSRRTGRERFPQDVLRFAQRVFEDDCGIHRFSVRFPARMNCPPLQRSFSSKVKPAWNHQPIRRRQSAVWGLR